ncbi:unnamed protein product [Heterobilharzia americana]|nr:unnamed protein product [Heterobilharzia americana]
MLGNTSRLIRLACIVGISICIYALHVEYSKESDKNYRAVCDISESISCSKVLTSKEYHLQSKKPSIWYNLLLFIDFSELLQIKSDN